MLATGSASNTGIWSTPHATCMYYTCRCSCFSYWRVELCSLFLCTLARPAPFTTNPSLPNFFASFQKDMSSLRCGFHISISVSYSHNSVVIESWGVEYENAHLEYNFQKCAHLWIQLLKLSPGLNQFWRDRLGWTPHLRWEHTLPFISHTLNGCTTRI